MKAHGILFVGIALVSLTLGMIIEGTFFAGVTTGGACERNHLFVNPLIDCIDTEAAFSRIDTSEAKVQSFVDYELNNNNATRISVFYRNLKNLRWYGINQLDSFSPGSLLKLPIAIAYFKLAEIDPTILARTIPFTQNKESLNNLEHFKATSSLTVGKRYTTLSLIESMIKDSDNDVVPLLVNSINKEFYEKVLLDLGVHIPLPQDGGIHSDFFTASTFSGMLRTLYNSSYLHIESSQQILSMLSQASFKEGLVKGVPEDVVVSHKFGEGIAINPDTMKIVKLELHDCGIVYKKGEPYILCVMTEGQDFNQLSRIIGSISKIVYEN